WSEYFKSFVGESSDTDGIRLSEESTVELELIQNNDTRWNSTYLMIERALRKHAEIQIFLEHYLTNEDWIFLTEIKEILEPLYRQTLRTQGWAKEGHHGALWEILTGVEYLMEGLEDWKTFFDDHSQQASGLAS
ncbi:transposase-like protein, partial [Colletotrichum musicola]